MPPEGEGKAEKYYTKVTEMYKKCFVQIGKYLICKFVRYVEFDFFNRKIIAKTPQKCYADSN